MLQGTTALKQGRVKAKSNGGREYPGCDHRRRSRRAADAAEALLGWFRRNGAGGVADYSSRALARVWQGERFSWYLTKLMHRFPDDSLFERRMQLAELDYIATSRAAQQTIAENYVGLPV